MFTGIAAWLAKSFIGGWLGKIGAAIKWVFADIHRVIIALLLAATAWLWVGKASEARRADKWAVASAKWQQSYNWMVVASARNRAAQIALNKSVTDKQTQIGKLVDENETNRLKIASRADLYADRMRYANYCPGRTDTAPESRPPTRGDGPDPDAVILSRIDFDRSNAIIARMMDVNAWGDEMIEAGLAVKIGEVETSPR